MSYFRIKTPRAECRQHLAFVKELPCQVCGHPWTDPAHLRFGAIEAGKRKVGIGEKADDRWVVPLCRTHHDYQHNMNEQQFWEEVGINPLPIAAYLWGISGNVELGEQIVRYHRENRKVSDD